VARFLRDRDEESFRTLYRAHTPALFRIAWRLSGRHEEDAEEIVQETWIRAARTFGRFGWRSSLRTWLTSIAINVSRENRRSGRALREGLPEPAAPPEAPDLRADLERALADLPEGYREVLVLHAIEGFTHREIACILGIDEGTSKSQLFHARRAMRLLIDTSGGR